jgi:hypothetical protein
MISNPEKTHKVPAEPESNRTTNTSQGNGSYTPPRSRHGSLHGDRASESEFVGPPLKYDTIDATAPPPRDYEQRLQVRVIEAHHVPSAHRYGRQAAPFVTLHFQLGPSAPAMAVRTESIGSTLAPRYGDSFIFGFDAALEPKAVILVALEDRHASIIDETMGQSVRIPLSLLQQRQSKSLEGWFDLSTHNIEHGRTLRLTESLAHNSEVSQVRMLISILPPLAHLSKTEGPRQARNETHESYAEEDLCTTPLDSSTPPARHGEVLLTSAGEGQVGLTFRDSVLDRPRADSQTCVMVKEVRRVIHTNNY